MKITDVEVAYLKMPTISEISNGTQDVAVVLVHTDEGITGIGEAETSPHVAKAVVDAPRSHSVMVGLREVLVGENPLDIERLWRKMYQATIYMGRRGVVLHAISGIDIALWDIKGKAYGQPVCDLLGGDKRPAHDRAANGAPAAESFVDLGCYLGLLFESAFRLDLRIGDISHRKPTWEGGGGSRLAGDRSRMVSSAAGIR